MRGISRLAASCLVASTIVAGGLAAPAPVAMAAPATVPDDTAGVNGVVYALAQAGDTIYIGGQFTWCGPYTGNGTAVNTSDGHRLLASAKPNGIVRAATSDNSGGWFVAGDFTRMGKLARVGVARIGSSGTVSAWKADVTGSVHAVAVSGSIVYLAGDFTAVAGQARAGLAAVGKDGNLRAWNPGSNGPVEALAVSPDGTTVYAGGSFTSAGGASRQRLVAIDAATGSATAWNPGADGPVRALAVSGTTVYAGGSFTSAGGSSRANLAAIDAATGSATGWNPGTDGPVNALAVSGDGSRIFVGGSFAGAGGGSRSNLAAIGAAAGNVEDWDPSPDGEVRALGLSGDGSRLFLGGAFRNVAGVSRERAAAVSTSTGSADGWDPRAEALVRAIALSGSQAYVGGDFTQLNGAPRNNAAAIDATTGDVDLTWDPDPDGVVRAVEVSADAQTVYLGGTFTHLGATYRGKVGAVDASTGSATSWKANASGEVRAIETIGDRVYVGGFFKKIAGVSRPFLASVSASTSQVDLGFQPQPNGNVRALLASLDGTKLYAGGGYSAIGGAPRPGAAELDGGTGVTTSWAPSQGGVVLALALSPDGSHLYFSTTSNRTRDYVPASSNDPLWVLHTGGDVQAIAATAEAIYIGGHFTKLTSPSNIRRVRIGSVNPADGTATSWAPGMNGTLGTWALRATPTALLVGGDFTKTGGSRQPGFARYSGAP